MQRATWLVGMAVGGALGAAMVAQAALGGAAGVRIPYQGVLERDGQPLSGSVSMRFDLYNGTNGVPSTTPCFTFTPSQPVDVAQGRFSVVITGVPEACVTAAEVYVGTRITPPGGTEVSLQGRQRIHPALGAYTSGAGDFVVTGALTAGSVSTTGAVNAGSVSSTGNVTVPGQLSFGSATRQMINTWSTGYGLGVQDSTQYFRSDANFAFYRGGTHSNTALAPGAGGLTLMTLDNNGNGNFAGRVSRQEFQVSCAEGLSGSTYGYCCRMNVRDGGTACKRTNSSTWSSWTDVNGAFAASTDGPYALSCTQWVAGVGFPMCCRVGASGASQCVMNQNADLGGAWTAAATPW